MNWLADVDAVFFDAVGTLIYPEPSAALAYAQIGQRHGSALSVEVVRQRFADAFTQEEAMDKVAGWRTSDERERQRRRDIVAAVLDDVADPAACFAGLYEHFAQATAWRVEPQAAAVLSTLAARGVVLGMASNYDWRLRNVAAGLPALAAVRHFAISSELGWRKPAPQFYTALAAQVGLPAERILVVGDDWDNDYVGAWAAGLQALWFDPRGQATREGRRIGRLIEVLGA